MKRSASGGCSGKSGGEARESESGDARGRASSRAWRMMAERRLAGRGVARAVVAMSGEEKGRHGGQQDEHR